MIGDAAVPLILARVERGDRVAAYRDAKALVAAWPANARAHYALAYVSGTPACLTKRLVSVVPRMPSTRRSAG